jgi:hypothetical protein
LTYFGSAPDIDVYNPEVLGTWALPVEAPEGTDEDLETACETWAAVVDAAGMPDTETARAAGGSIPAPAHP